MHVLSVRPLEARVVSIAPTFQTFLFVLELIVSRHLFSLANLCASCKIVQCDLIAFRVCLRWSRHELIQRDGLLINKKLFQSIRVLACAA